MVDMTDYLEAYKNLQDKSPQELVDLALEHIVNVTPVENLILQELCSRVDPGWENREPRATQETAPVRMKPSEEQVMFDAVLKRAKETSAAPCERCGGDGIDPDADYVDFGNGPEAQPRPCKKCGQTCECCTPERKCPDHGACVTDGYV